MCVGVSVRKRGREKYHNQCMENEGEKEMVCALEQVRQNGEGRHYVERVRKKMVKAFGVL